MDQAYQPREGSEPEHRIFGAPARWALLISAGAAVVGLLVLWLVLRGWDAGDGAEPAPAPPAAVAAGRVTPSPAGVYRATGRIQLDQLPAEFFLGPVAGPVPEELHQKRDLVLDGATLVLGDQAANGRVRSIVANIVRLENGARIVTNGADLEIMANQIVSDGGRVVAFEFVEAARQVSGSAPAPSASTGSGVAAPSRPSTASTELGTPGAGGGLLRLVALTPLQGRLTVRLNGQDGADGQPGRPGEGAAAVSFGGGDAIGNLIDCSTGNLERAVSGGPGGQGGAGGAGGNGGVLELVGPIAGSRNLIEFQAEPGIPGRGGAGGAGGQGGVVRNPACGGGGFSPSGALGPQGGPGPTGEEGQPGRVVLRPDGV